MYSWRYMKNKEEYSVPHFCLGLFSWCVVRICNPYLYCLNELIFSQNIFHKNTNCSLFCTPESAI